ncbi:MAG: TlpA family protein disulfide reductase [Chitinophagaceae bacterium]|nr:TlpA family protein disulfide reductase [Chitinophagaceae bacterium]
MLKKEWILLVMMVLLTCACIAQKANVPVEVVKMDWYQKLRKSSSDTTYILNFWATWCVPCVAELPYFEQIHQNYADRKVKVILVSLDYVKQKEKLLEPFIQKKKIHSKVVLLNEPNYNAWIDQIDPSWSGTLPATQIFNPKYSRLFFIEGETTFAILDSLTLNSIRP